MAQAFFACNNLHCSAAENKRRAYKNGITDFLCNLYAFFNIGYGKPLRLRNTESVHNLFKRISVFGSVDSLNIRAYNRHTERVKRRRKVNCSLTAEGNYDSERLFKLYNIHNILNAERLEIELIGGSVVCGNRFGVIVYDNGLIARVADRPNCMHGGIIEFNALANSDRAGAKHDDFLFI